MLYSDYSQISVGEEAEFRNINGLGESLEEMRIQRFSDNKE